MTLYVPDGVHLLRFIPHMHIVGKKFSRPLYIKKVFFFPPPRHVSCEKARWRAVQEPTVPGLSIYNDPRSHKPLPSQWIAFSNSTHSKFIYLLLYVHTLLTYTHGLRVDTEAAGHGVLSPRSTADKNVEPSFATHVVYSTMACMSACSSQPVCLSWAAASMLTVLSASTHCNENGYMAGHVHLTFLLICSLKFTLTTFKLHPWEMKIK